MQNVQKALGKKPAPPAAPARPLSPFDWLRLAGHQVAWIVGLACGWRAAQECDLLEAVIRGALAWLAVVVICLAGVRLGERLVRPQPDPSTAADASAKAQ